MVAEVAGGDTFQLKSGKRVRLMGVDAPELDRCGGLQAKKDLTGLILGKQVRLAEGVTEKYGRTTGRIPSGTFSQPLIMKPKKQNPACGRCV